MSINYEIRRWTRESPARLFFLPPLIGGAAVRRELFVSEEIQRAVQPPWEPSEQGARYARMRGYLDTWTEGRLISIADHPYRKPKPTFMARIDPAPDEVFDIRCIDPNPGIRVMGCFADRDLFIALTMADRDALATRHDWRNEREACKAAWRRLFPSYPPYTGATLNEYVSTNCLIV